MGTFSTPEGMPEVEDSFIRDRESFCWDGGAPVRPEDTVSGTVDRFRPRDVPDALWDRINAMVKDAVIVTGPTRMSDAENQLTILAQLVVWADRIGQPLVPEVLLRPDTIDRFIHEGCARLTPGSRTNYRTQLWKIGAAVLGPSVYPPKSIGMPRSGVVPPYSAAEVTDLTSWGRGLPTAYMRRNVRALLGIGLGAGLMSEDIQRLVGTDITVHGADVVVNVVASDKPRKVPVLPEWADDVLALAQESGDLPYFCPERDRITARDIISFIERGSPDHKARFNVQQLRVTWIVHHLSINTHLLLLTAWAGVRPEQLMKYLPFATLPAELSPLSYLAPMVPLEVRRAKKRGAGTGG